MSAEAAPSKLGWYMRRVSRMSPGEIVWRFREQAVRRAWAARQVQPGQVAGLPPLDGKAARPRAERKFGPALAPRLGGTVPEQAKAAIIADADKIMAGEWTMLGVTRTDMKDPDWFRCPATGQRSDPETYAFSVNHREESAVGNIKQVWEVSRLQHLTLLAAAWYLTGDDAYAQRVDGAAARLVGGEPVPVRRQLDERDRAGHPADELRLDPAPAGRLARGRRTCSRATTSRCARSAGTRSTSPRSRAGAHRPTTT